MVLRDAYNDIHDYKPNYNFNFFIPRSYYYYDTPDGQDLVKKLWFLTTTFGKAGVVHGAVMANLGEPDVKNFSEACVRVLRYTQLYMAVPFIFATTTHFLTNIREKDLVSNYAIGGFLAGQFHGYWSHSMESGMKWAVFYSIIAASFKYNQQNGMYHRGRIVPWQNKVQTVNSLQKWDFSRVPEYPRNWYHADEVREKKLALPQGAPVFHTPS